MNILELIKGILGMDAFLGIMPESPDKCIVLAEYQGRSEAYFDQTVDTFNVQARCRAKTAQEAYSLAASVKAALDRYAGQGIAIRQATPILDIGQDDKKRREYTVNFTITSTGG